jgi:hypothetical protein
MSSERFSGIVLFIGSVIFLVAAFLPISWVFGERIIEKKLEMINAARGSWEFAQVLFGSGAIVTALGFMIAYLHLRGKEADTASLVAFLSALVGALLWCWHVWLRGTDPDAFVHRLLFPNWPAGAYFILMQVALFSFGLALLQARCPSWVGRLNIGASVVSFLILVILGDLPPFVYYIITAITAIVLIG